MGEKPRIERYMLKWDAKNFFPNWDMMAKEEQQEWKKKLKAFQEKYQNK